ncbi:MAG: alpha-amylase/4-alpha-glucanotransferase domain-containing protein, partial [Thermoplasmata archaeon]
MSFKPKTINFAFALHNHQPVGNFEGVFEEAYRTAYLPFLEVLEAHPKIKMTLHYTGILFDWLARRRPEFVLRLKQLVERGQLELMTGGFYEPIFPSIPDRDKLGQIKKLTNFIKEKTGYEATGMWLAERVWEPYLPKPICEAGIKYVLIDDEHFKLVGMTENELHGAYVTEEQGYAVTIFPIDMKLRYLIPFRMVHETVDYLRSLATEDGSRIAVMADDGEKFGSWPGTYNSVYGERWLENFFTALEQNSDWIKTTTFSEYLKKYPQIGRVYLPTASYAEMMEWSLPTSRGIEYSNALRELKNKGLESTVGKFVRGGFWRFFFVKYPESNNMNKKMLLVSEKVRRLGDISREMLLAKDGDKGVKEHEQLLEKAKDELWQGQCNCPYWHGVF